MYKSVKPSPKEKCPRDMNRTFSYKEIKTIKKHMRKCSKSLIIREMQIKTTLRYYLTPSRIAKMMDFFTSSCNAKTQNNAEGLLKKRAATHIQRKICGSRNTEKKNYLNSWVDGDTTGDIETKQPI